MKIVPPFFRSIALIWNLLYNGYHAKGREFKIEDRNDRAKRGSLQIRGN